MRRLLQGDCRALLAEEPAESVHACVTSIPYYALRSYGTDPQVWGGREGCEHDWRSERHYIASGGAAGSSREAFSEPGEENAKRIRDARWREDETCTRCPAWRGELGLEPTVDLYVEHVVEVFAAVWRVLRRDGTCWLNIADSYHGGGNRMSAEEVAARGDDRTWRGKPYGTGGGLKPKDLCLVPQRLALALQAAGWWVRCDVIWCLSGGTRVYARTQKGEMPMTIKDLVRLRPETVQLWNGEKWTQVKGWSQSPRPEQPLEIELRSGERISCTPNHEWPTQRGNVRAEGLRVGDVIQTCQLPPREHPKEPAGLTEDVGWFVGLYLAEGSRSDTTIQFSGHVKEERRFERLCKLAADYHGTCRVHRTGGNNAPIHLYGPVLAGILDTYVSGNTARYKHLDVRCWERSNDFLLAVLMGYLEGDGHYDAKNDRWRLGFCDNDNLAADLRTICARLGISLRLRRTQHRMGEQYFPGWKGEIVFKRSAHGNVKQDGEIVAIRKSRARKFWDIGVEDEPHLFALASGVLTHNSKPNPMPESLGGWSWRRCRVKVEDSGRVPEAHSTAAYGVGTAQSNGLTRAGREGRVPAAAEWAPCPGCPRCEPNGGLVLSRDSGRPTKAHEYLFLLARGPSYYWDAEAVKEKQTGNAHTRGNGLHPKSAEPGLGIRANGSYESATAPLTNLPGGRNLRSVWTINPQPFLGAHFACVDEETECLTPEGWRKESELDDSAFIAAYDHHEERLCWEKATIHRYPYNGEMVSIEKRDTSQLLTPNHRCLVRTRTRSGLQVEVVTADSLKSRMDLPTSAPFREWAGRGFGSIGEDWAELLGFYIAEGHNRWPARIWIYQSQTANPATCDRIRELLREVGADFSEKVRHREWRGRPSVQVEWAVRGTVASRLQELAPCKQVTPALATLPENEARALLGALIAGDGHRRADGRACVIQSSREAIDGIQMLAVVLGYRAHVSRRKDGQHVLYLTEGRWLTLRGTGGRSAEFPLVPYQGTVWCPSIPSGFWLARRNGKPFITGNTYPEELVRRCILASTSEAGCCPACGAQYARVIEEGEPDREWQRACGGDANGLYHGAAVKDYGAARAEDASSVKARILAGMRTCKTTGWRPTCACAAGDPRPCTILDPFTGSGTTGLVAKKHGRNFVGCELKEEYAVMAEERIGERGQGCLF